MEWGQLVLDCVERRCHCQRETVSRKGIRRSKYIYPPSLGRIASSSARYSDPLISISSAQAHLDLTEQSHRRSVSSFTMSQASQRRLFPALLVVTVLLSWANATPIESRNLMTRDVPADDISMYTTQVSQVFYTSVLTYSPRLTIVFCFLPWNRTKNRIQYFLDHYIYKPPPSACLFYTFELTSAAQNFSKGGENELTTIWVSYECTLNSTSCSKHVQSYIVLN